MSFHLLWENLIGKCSLFLLILFIVVSIPFSNTCLLEARTGSAEIGENRVVTLPAPKLDSSFSVEKALASRRSVRRYSEEAVTLSDVSQILWSGQGITLPERGYRTAPSAGARFPLQTYIIAGNVEGLEPGLYSYLPEDHSLINKIKGDLRQDMLKEAVRPAFVGTAPFIVLIAAQPSTMRARYGEERGDMFIYMEVGHASQNIHLQAESLNLGTVVIGAFDPAKVSQLLNLPEDIMPIYLMPVGNK